jgi:hypothetical protein
MESAGTIRVENVLRQIADGFNPDKPVNRRQRVAGRKVQDRDALLHIGMEEAIETLQVVSDCAGLTPKKSIFIGSA